MRNQAFFHWEVAGTARWSPEKTNSKLPCDGPLASYRSPLNRVRFSSGFLPTIGESVVKKPDSSPTSHFDSFKELTRKLLSVPKKEIDAKEAAHQRKKQAKRRRKDG
jgi:hypothetical protein